MADVKRIWSEPATEEKPPEPTYVMGLDLGQSQDYTALAILERQEDIYTVRHLRRWPLGERYTQIVADVIQAQTRAPLTEGSPLVIDKTGVGRGVYDLFLAAGLAPIGVTIHGGREVAWDGDGVRVPKRDLVAAVQVLLENQRLKIVLALSQAAVLAQELRGFRVKISASGHDSYEAGDDWRTAPHDDLVLAVALAAWWGERQINPEDMFAYW